MASAVLAKPPGVPVDDEEWLYGGEGETEKEPAAPGTGPAEKLPPPKEREEGEMSTSEPASQSQDKDDDDDDSDDDDDDVQVTIGDIKAFPVSSGSGLFKPGTTYQKQPVVAAPGQKSVGGGSVPAKGVDVDGEGQVNGISLYEFSLDTLRDEDKPWRKPGADITDYFNYGFNEDTWRKYCQKQTRIRMDNGVSIPKAFNYTTPSSGHSTTTVKVEQEPVRTTRPPTQSQPFTGAIAVLGSTAASRRPADEQMDQIQTIGTLGANVNKPPPGMPPIGMPAPDFSVPPPGMPHMPPGFSPAVPPPGMSVPPPNMFSHPPPPVAPPFFPPGHHLPPPNVSERPPFSSYDTTPTQSTFTDSINKSWDSRDDRDSYRDRDRDYYSKRDRSPGGSGYSSGGSDDYNRYSRSSRDYGGSSRDYESREYSYRGGRDSDRSRSDRDRDRSSSRSRDRDRRHRDRDRDKSKRKIKDEPDDSDYYKSSSSSKHKKSKRSKRDKDDDDKTTDT